MAKGLDRARFAGWHFDLRIRLFRNVRCDGAAHASTVFVAAGVDACFVQKQIDSSIALSLYTYLYIYVVCIVWFGCYEG